MDASIDTLLAHRAWVRALAATLVRPGDADDLEQEAWLAAVERPPRGDAPRAWLATVLRRTASNMRRTLARRGSRERAAARPEATAAAADLVARAETHERVVRAVLALAEPYRSTILLRFFEGLAPREIARRTGTPVETVKARLRRGLARLRADLREDRAWSAAILALALPRRPPASGQSLPLRVLAMTLKTKLALAAGVLLLAGSLVTYRALDRAPAPVRADPPVALAPAANAPPEIVAAPGAPPLPVPADAPAREFTVRGFVRGADGPIYFDPRMMRPLEPFAIAEGRLWRPLRSTGSARGDYEVRFPFLATEAPCEVELGVVAFGFVRQSRRLAVEPGGEYVADFVLVRGASVTGVVTDPEGRPVGHLEILAVASEIPPWGFVTQSILDTTRRLLAGEAFAQGQADSAGRFEIRGLVPGTYALFARSPDWILEHAPLAAPAEGVAVVAVPAHAITGTVRDARTGAYVSDVAVDVTLRTPGGSGSEKRGSGGLWIAWKPQRREIEEGFETTLRVRAPGYHAAEQVLTFPRGTRRASADVALEPVDWEKLPVLRVEVTDTRGGLVDLDLFCTLVGADDPKVQPTVLDFHRVGPGVFELRAPAGRWWVGICPRWQVGEVRWTGTVELGREEQVRCTLPSFGVVRLHHAGTDPWTAVWGTADGTVTQFCQIETGDVGFVAPPGEWQVGCRQEELRTIVVVDGAETTVELK